MYRRQDRFSVPVFAMAAAVTLVVVGGTAGLFTSRSVAAPHVDATIAAEALPMRELEVNRIDVVAVRERDMASAATPVPRRGRS